MFTSAEHKAYIQSHGCTFKKHLDWCCLCDDTPIPDKLKTPEYFEGVRLALAALKETYDNAYM